jgi:hypothetical protein
MVDQLGSTLASLYGVSSISELPQRPEALQTRSAPERLAAVGEYAKHFNEMSDKLVTI